MFSAAKSRAHCRLTLPSLFFCFAYRQMLKMCTSSLEAIAILLFCFVFLVLPHVEKVNRRLYPGPPRAFTISG